MDAVTAPDHSQSRAILIGVSDYHDPEFPMLPAASNSLDEMREILVDPDLCGWPQDRVIAYPNPENAGRFAQQLRRIAEQTRGVLLLYFVGHGTISPRGDLCFALTDTEADGPEFTGLEYTKVKDILLGSPAETKIVILDCCYAGRAIEVLAGEESLVADSTEVRGVYTLTATESGPAHVVPLAEQEQVSTTFTGELAELVRTGVAGAPATLNLALLYGQLLQRLMAAGFPRPYQRGTDMAQHFPFTRNAAVTGGSKPPRTPRPRSSTSAAPDRRTTAPRPPAPRNAGPRGSRTQPRAATPAGVWPDPGQVDSIAGYITTLRRTWMRAGAPSHEEIERRAGGFLSAGDSRVLLETNSAVDIEFVSGRLWDDSILFLEACGVSEDLIGEWRQAIERVRQKAPRQKIIEERAKKRDELFRNVRKYNRHWLAKCLACALTGGAGYTLLGAAFARIPRVSIPGTDWWAFGVTTSVILSLSVAAMFNATEWLRYPLSRRVNISIVLVWGAGFALGWLGARHVTTEAVPRVSQDVLNWSIWRF